MTTRHNFNMKMKNKTRKYTNTKTLLKIFNIFDHIEVRDITVFIFQYILYSKIFYNILKNIVSFFI